MKIRTGEISKHEEVNQIQTIKQVNQIENWNLKSNENNHTMDNHMEIGVRHTLALTSTSKERIKYQHQKSSHLWMKPHSEILLR
jgi:hypothetical protein